MAKKTTKDVTPDSLYRSGFISPPRNTMQVVRCRVCGKRLNARNKAKGRGFLCRKCDNERQRKYYNGNPEQRIKQIDRSARSSHNRWLEIRADPVLLRDYYDWNNNRRRKLRKEAREA